MSAEDSDLQRVGVRRAIRRLPARERAAVILRVGEHLSDEEIAVVLGCRPATARSLVGRGVQRVRAEMARDAHLVVARA